MKVLEISVLLFLKKKKKKGFYIFTIMHLCRFKLLKKESDSCMKKKEKFPYEVKSIRKELTSQYCHLIFSHYS